ncbi:MAG: N-acetylmuramoyl-L-alanine amidase [Chitinophagaceae bacterium]|nr:N-acetylmuramoyl-L-alanine amidase [Chitinophagaceae bacterium]MCA6513495.1 N-acetylmuramoyl-L-alanine amidase [Chitinophagaceae bacterium]
MIATLYYLLKVVLCSTLLYAYYWFILRDKQFHQYNRFYLMGISVISWLVPFIKIEIVKEQVVAAPKVLHFATAIAESNSSIEREVIEQSAQFSWDKLILLIATIVSVFFILRFLQSLWKIKRLIRQYPMKELLGFYLVMTDVKGTPFSFFKYVFWNNSIDLHSELGKGILAHEVAHVEENHSFDKLLIELQLVFGWFNPILWLIRNELYLIHEFIADKKSVENNDVSVLAELLLASAYPSQQHLLSNPFFFSPIKRRIQMFTKTKTKYSYLRRLTILPILAVMVLLFAFRNHAINSKPITHLDKKYTVIVDAGHGGHDLGATTTDGTNEKNLTLAIAQKIKSLNNNPNINIILTRESDKFVDLVERANFANASNANLFLSIHIDNSKSPKSTGASCFIPSKNYLYINKSNVFAKNILMATNGLFTNGKLKTRDKGIWVLENAQMPAVLFESGYMSNSNDLQFVKENISNIAGGLLAAIEAYLANENTLTTSLPEATNEISTNTQNINRVNSKKIDTTRYQIVTSEITISNKRKPELQIPSHTGKYEFDSSMLWPVENGTVTDKFGRVLVPGTKKIFTNNTFVTIATDESAKVKSINNGEVTYIGNLSDNDILVMIKHNEIYSTYSNIVPNVKVGQMVSRGQVIGTVNTSVKGKHALTFGISDEKGNFIDPEEIVKK